MTTAEQLRVLAKKHDLSFNTLYWRYYRLKMRGKDLIQQPQMKGKFHIVTWEGRTYLEWQEWLKENGVHISMGGLKGNRYRALKKGLSEEQALFSFLEKQGVLEVYKKETGQ